MDINRAERIIKSNCKISSILPISGECNENCEFYCNCLKTNNPCYWEIPTHGKVIVIEAISTIQKYCMSTMICEECEFYSLCGEKTIPSFWKIKNSIDVE